MVAPQVDLVAALLLTATMFINIGHTNADFCTPNIGSCWPDKAALSQWIATLSGDTSVWLPDRTPDMFISAAANTNALKTNFPGIIIAPVSERDLRSALIFAAQRRLRVTARCSGHDYNGRSNGRGVMLIRMEKFNNVEYDPSTQLVTFGAGATHEDVYAALAEAKRIFVGAHAKTICPAGCLAGGCYGLFSRKYGLGIDSIEAIRLMLSNGTILTTNRDSFADLFHAYLGAGHNTYGVAVSFIARTYQAPRQILKLEVKLNLLHPYRPGATFPNLFSEYLFNLRWFNSLPSELSGTILVEAGIVYIKYFYVGEDYVGAFNALQTILNSPYYLDVSPITNYTSVLDVVVDNHPPAEELWARTFITNAFVPARQEILNNASRLIGATMPPMQLWLAYGGAVRNGTTGTVPFGMRTAMYEVLFSEQWHDASLDEERMAGVDGYLSTLYAFGTSSCNNEYTTWGNKYNALNDWKTRFFSDYNALMRAKLKYDPCNRFTVRYGIGSDLPTGVC